MSDHGHGASGWQQPVRNMQQMSDAKLATLLSGADADDSSASPTPNMRRDEADTSLLGGALSAFARSTSSFHSETAAELDKCHERLAASLISKVKSIAPFLIAARLAPDLQGEVARALSASKARLCSLGDVLSEQHREAHRDEVKAQVTLHTLITPHDLRCVTHQC